MARYEKTLKILGVCVVGGCLQIALALVGGACSEDWPRDAAIEFTKAYFQRDPAIAGRICREHLDVHAIDDDRQQAAEAARSRGLGFSYVTSVVYHIKTETVYAPDTGTEADVRIRGKRRVSINPVYPLVAILFDIGEVHRIDESLRVIKEENQWKVCEPYGSVFQDT